MLDFYHHIIYTILVEVIGYFIVTMVFIEAMNSGIRIISGYLDKE